MLKSDVIKFYQGSVSKTAMALGITSPSVSLWGEIIPEKQALKLEKITKGKLKYNAKLYDKKAA